MPHWTNQKGDPKGRNDCVYSDPASESSHAEFKHGNFSNTAKTVSKEVQLGEEGSRGLEINQGFLDTAIAIQPTHGEIGQNHGRIKTEAQGTHAQFGYKGKKVSRERV